jgi:hypothetical protein
MPNVTGPVAVIAESHPYLDMRFALRPMNLDAIGYVEEELFVSGTANVYDWNPAGTAPLIRGSGPYTTRVLMRRPANRERFSGNVYVEISFAGLRQRHPVDEERYDAVQCATGARARVDDRPYRARIRSIRADPGRAAESRTGAPAVDTVAGTTDGPITIAPAGHASSKSHTMASGSTSIRSPPVPRCHYVSRT